MAAARPCQARRLGRGSDAPKLVAQSDDVLAKHRLEARTSNQGISAQVGPVCPGTVEGRNGDRVSWRSQPWRAWACRRRRAQSRPRSPARSARAHRARSYEGIEHPAKPTAARRSWPRWSSTSYSMTWSARPSTDGGIVRPSALAVFKLMTNSNRVGCSTGRSAGFAPLRILSTKVAARRTKSRRFAP